MQKTSDSLQQTAAVETGYYKFPSIQRLNKLYESLPYRNDSQVSIYCLL